MANLLEEVLELAKTVEALTDVQRQKILKLAPTMKETDLQNLKKLILDVKNSFDGAKHELDVRQKVASKFKQYKKVKAIGELHDQENKAQAEDSATAEQLINNL